MKRSITARVAMALCGLSLCLVAAPRAHAQGKTLFTARAAAEPGTIVVVDADGASEINRDLAGLFHTLCTDSVWTIQDTGQIQVTKDRGVLLQTQCWYGESQNYFFVHSRRGQVTVDGEIFRYKSDPTKGSANLWVTTPRPDGKSWTTLNVYVDLAFGAAQPGTNGGSPVSGVNW